MASHQSFTFLKTDDITCCNSQLFLLTPGHLHIAEDVFGDHENPQEVISKRFSGLLTVYAVFHKNYANFRKMAQKAQNAGNRIWIRAEFQNLDRNC